MLECLLVCSWMVCRAWCFLFLDVRLLRTLVPKWSHRQMGWKHLWTSKEFAYAGGTHQYTFFVPRQLRGIWFFRHPLLFASQFLWSDDKGYLVRRGLSVRRNSFQFPFPEYCRGSEWISNASSSHRWANFCSRKVLLLLLEFLASNTLQICNCYQICS